MNVCNGRNVSFVLNEINNGEEQPGYSVAGQLKQQSVNRL